MSLDQVYELMDRADELPYGEARTMLVEEALRHAEAGGDDLLAYQVRAELRVVYVQGGETAKAFAAFSRCLSDYDKDPGRFDEQDEHRLLWAFKGTVNALTDFPDVPLDRTYAVLDDMERRYRQGGHGMHPVYTYRCVVAQHVGDAEAADHWYARWSAAPRVRLSDCVGCDPGTKVDYLAWRGRDADALELAAPVLSQELTCAEQPQTILTELLPILLRRGELDRAADAHRRAYRVQRSRLSELWAVAAHLEFCARSGNEARGLEILERHLGWLDRAPTPHAGMSFAAAAALLLRRLGETGHPDVEIRRPEHGDRPAAGISAEALRAELTTYALDLAGRFDARNGASHQGDLVRATLAAEPLADHLPLAAHAPRRPARPARPEPLVDDAVEDPRDLLDLAEERWARQESAAALAAYRRAGRFIGEAADDPALAGRRADGAGLERLLAGDEEGALAEWERAAALHAAAGDAEREHSTRSRVGAGLAGTGRAGDGLPMLESALAALDESAPGTRRAAAARHRLAAALTGLDRPADALEILDAPAPSGDAAGVEGLLSAAGGEVVRARALMSLAEQDVEGAVRALRAACAGFREAAAPVPLAEPALMLAQILGAREDSAAEAGTLLGEAIAGAPSHAPEMRSVAHAMRGSWHLSGDRPAEAAEDLIEAVAGFTAQGLGPRAAYARLDLAVAYLRTERHLEAAEVAEEAGPLLAELGDAEAERRSRYLLGCALRDLGERDEAAGAFAALAAEEEPAIAGGLLEMAAELLDELDKDVLAAERFGEAAAAFEAAHDPIGVVRSRRRRALSLLWSGHGAAGLEAIAQARAALAGVPDDPANRDALTWHGSLISYDEARILASLGRVDEARARVAEAVEGFTALDEKDAAATAVRLRDDLADAG